ncbi:Exocyst complex component EXO70B1 [Vitis vinifera]|nr:Exocyst complex component EXO70B1 [Vitis vinifera]
MNYLKYACEYKDTLEEVFQQHQKIERTDEAGSDVDERSSQNNSRLPVKQTPFATQLIAVMDLLDSNLDTKSKLYKDMSLRYIFLMNNGRYILQKIKGSSEIHEVMGDTWCRRRSSDLRQYHKNYQRETWSKVLQCLRDEGLQVNGKVNKPVLKERFKTFNTLFDEIHKTQSTWVVSDEQLQSELRVSISAVMIPAYRSFLARFSQYLDSGRQTEKYVKYQPDDIETSIDELFDGNPTSMTRKRT